MTPYHADASITVFVGDCRAVLAELEPESIDCVVTSPPYFSLRDYGIPPTVWGGDPEHEHAWITSMRRAERSGSVHWQHTEGGGTRADGSFRNRHANEGTDADERREWAPVSTGFCECGAWLGSLGLEPDPMLFVEHVVEVFRAVRRVMRKDATLWLNLGDTYATGGGDHGGRDDNQRGVGARRAHDAGAGDQGNRRPPLGFKAKDRMMIPARVAIALQEDGWYLRDEIVWAKSNPMPSSVTDRTTPAHEMVYLLSKSRRYHYDGKAIAEPMAGSSIARINQPTFDQQTGGPKDYANGTNPNASARKALENIAAKHRRTPAGWNVNHDQPNTVGRYRQRDRNVGGRTDGFTQMPGGAIEEAALGRETRNKRSVWSVPTEPYPDAHFATFPTKLIEPMILAGCRPGGVVLDPFGGSGTVGLVAEALGRRATLIDLGPDYAAQMLRRIADGRRNGTGAALDMPLPAPEDSLWAIEAVS